MYIVVNPGKISTGEKTFQRRNLNYHVLETEGCRKLKFGEISLKSVKKILSKN